MKAENLVFHNNPLEDPNTNNETTKQLLRILMMDHAIRMHMRTIVATTKKCIMSINIVY
jgi:hypothetical protein